MSRLSALMLLLCAASPALAAPELEQGVASQDYNRAGRAVLAGLNPVRAALEAEDDQALRGQLHPGCAGRVAGLVWRPRVTAVAELRIADAAPQGELGVGAEGVLALARALREPLEHVKKVELKVDLVERVAADGSAHVRLRLVLYGPARGGGRGVVRASLDSRWCPVEGGLALAALSPRSARRIVGPGDLFRNRTTAWQLRHFGSADPRFLPPSTELRYQVGRHAIGGASAADVDGDGRDDLLLTRGDGLGLFLNRGGRLEDVTEAWGLGGVAHPNVCLAADFDGDGDADLFVGSFYGPNHLFENVGGRFRDVTATSGLGQDDMTAVAAAADFDGDGRLDLYLGRFLDMRSEVPLTMLYTRNGAPNKLYLSSGALRFRDASASSGADDVGLTLGAAAGDVDGDGDADIYLSNDFGRNVLLRNDGRGHFQDVALETGTLAVSGGMSATFADLDGDGRLDIYVSSIRSNQRWFSQDVNIRSYVLGIVQSNRRARLQELFLDLRKHMGQDWPQVGHASLKGNYYLRQRPDGTFADVSEEQNVNPQGWYWSSGAFDVDNDGRLDLFAVDGWISNELKDDL
ncbi:MAG: FG-GAP repeat domain-containing protein [Planctomycetota bacterium]